MRKIKYQSLVGASLICTGLFLSSYPLGAIDFEESNLIGSKKPTRPKHDWENKKPQGQARNKDYIETHNRIARKYGLNNHIINPRASHQGPTLVELSEEFVDASNHLKEIKGKDLEKVNTFGKQFVDGIGDAADIAIEEGVENTKTQSRLKRLKGMVINNLKNLFN
ncbi:MAG: hypothetical protein BGO67_10290 [Alphaproteobacteria bacterium 41-28]|nr:MAG: hypothetical protein BGO67_10290 [Alphaproteobacteria bacterium 41-28]